MGKNSKYKYYVGETRVSEHRTKDGVFRRSHSRRIPERKPNKKEIIAGAMGLAIAAILLVGLVRFIFSGEFYSYILKKQKKLTFRLKQILRKMKEKKEPEVFYPTKKVLLGENTYTSIEERDWEKIKELNLFMATHPIKKRKCVYVKVTAKGTQTTKTLHRVLTGCSDGRSVVHLDGNLLNNTRSNLHVCSKNQAKKISKEIQIKISRKKVS